MKATKSQLRQEISSLRRTGGQLAAIAFNMGQESAYKEVDAHTKEVMRRVQREWDAIPRSEKAK